MKRILKWLGIVLGVLLIVLVVAITATQVMAQSRLNKTYNVDAQTSLIIPADEAALARGEHLVTAVSHCDGCHGADLGGVPFIDDPTIGLIYSPNLTMGQGGLGATYTAEDWVRSLTHGVAPDGRMLLVMPSQHFRHYSDEDLAAIIAYVKSVPPVDREKPENHLSILGRTLFAIGGFGQMPAEMIDHNAPRPTAPVEGVTVEYGEHLATVGVCRDCHMPNLAGGRPAPSDPYAPNLTPGGELAGWTQEDFINTIRTGVTPAGRELNPMMPWESYRNMTDAELQAIWLYLQSLPALPSNEG